MFWKTLNLVVNLTFLLLAITIMTILLKNENYRSDFLDYKIAFDSLKEQVRKVNDANIVYYEGRINRLAENQDSYQSTMSTRVLIVEQKLDKLEKENKELKLQQKNIINNTNTATAIVNGKKQ